MLSLAVEAPLVVPLVTPSVLLLLNGRIFVEGAGFNFAAGGGVETTALAAGLTGSVLGLFVNIVDFVVAGFVRLLGVVATGVVFFGTSVFSAGFLGYIFEGMVLVIGFFSMLDIFESFLFIDKEW